MLPHSLPACILALVCALSPALAQQPLWIAPEAPAPAGEAAKPLPFWIWPVSSDNLMPTEDFARAGTVWLARTFEAPANTRSARLALAADNHAVAYLNGKQVLRSDSWSSVVFAEVTIQPGDNLLAIEATNDAGGAGKNPAGVITRLTMVLDDGSTSTLCTDGAWRGGDVKWPGFPGAGPEGGAMPSPRSPSAGPMPRRGGSRRSL